jgi:hypothetical protein
MFVSERDWIASNVRPKFGVDSMFFGVVGEHGHAAFQRIISRNIAHDDWPGITDTDLPDD